jgi:hypothetical protein
MAHSSYFRTKIDYNIQKYNCQIFKMKIVSATGVKGITPLITGITPLNTGVVI